MSLVGKLAGKNECFFNIWIAGNDVNNFVGKLAGKNECFFNKWIAGNDVNDFVGKLAVGSSPAI